MVTRGVLADLDRAVAAVREGDSIYLGGAVLDRKPMAFVHALAASGTRSLDVMSFAASIDVDVLIAVGSVRSVATAYTGLGRLGRAPAFSAAVTAGLIEDREYSEWTMLGGLRAAAMGVPFLPTRAAAGSQIVDIHDFRTVEDPYTGHGYLALPPLRPDVAVIHAWRASAAGTIQTAWPPDHLYDVDVLAARAARTVIVTVEEIVPDGEVAEHAEWTILLPVDVDMVVAAPRGAWPTAAWPAYEADHDVIAEYQASGSIAALVEQAA